MKKIINRKVYDTETAVPIEKADSIAGNFNDYRETLYRKRTGEYFLYGEGGPASRYAKRLPSGGFTEGKNIFPLSDEEALDWMELNLDPDELEQILLERDESLRYQRINITLPPEVLRKGRETAEKKGLTLSAYISELIKKD